LYLIHSPLLKPTYICTKDLRIFGNLPHLPFGSSLDALHHYRFAHRGGITGLSYVGSNASNGGGDWMLVSVGADGCANWYNVEDDAKTKSGL